MHASSPATALASRERFVSPATPSRQKSVREIVLARRIHYEVGSEIVLVGDQLRQVGYELTLWAAHERAARALPGCPKCLAIFEDLVRIASWITADVAVDSRWELLPFNRVLYDSAQFPSTDEIELSLKLLHRDCPEGAVDACQKRCLRDVRHRLADLGIAEGRWRPAIAAHREDA